MDLEKIGIYDTEGKYNNPFTGKPYENIYKHIIKDIKGEKQEATYANLAKIWKDLTVYNHKDELLESININQVILAKAGTGVGKTVLIPKIALHAFGYKEAVITTIPKRLITKSNAEFAAQCMDSKVGDYVGYYYKGENKTSKNTKLIFTTTGSILSKITGNDPYLKDYKCIIIDEAHERSIQTDQILLLIKKALLKRKDLKLIIMSATINLEVFRKYYSMFDFGEVDIKGITYPVKEYWINNVKNWYEKSIELVMKILKTSNDGDILIFGKSGSDSIKVCFMLENEITKYNKTNPDNKFFPYCVRLVSGSSNDEKYYSTEKTAYLELKTKSGENYTRKVVVASNVAESSLTVDGIVYVIDSGLFYEEGYEPETMVRYLVEEECSQSSILQRKGRAGRTKEGFCFHLYTKDNFYKRPKYPLPDIQKSDITNYLLDLLRLEYIKNIGDLKELLSEFISPPQQQFINSGLRILHSIGAISGLKDNNRITKIGYKIAKFRGIKAGMALSLLLSKGYNCYNEVVILTAFMIVLDGIINNIFSDIEYKKKSIKKEVDNYNRKVKQFNSKEGDFKTLLNIYNSYLIEKNKTIAKDEKVFQEELNNNNNSIGGGRKNKLEQWCRKNYLKYRTLRKVDIKIKEINRIYKTVMGKYIYPITIKGFNNKDKNLMLCMAIGNIYKLAIKSDGKKYTPCFPIKEKITELDQTRTTIDLRQQNRIIIFDELFLMNKTAKKSKANVVNIVPNDVMMKVKSIGNYIEKCYKKKTIKKKRQLRKTKKNKFIGML